MIREIRRDVVHLALDGRPSVVLFIVHLEHGRWDAQERLHTLGSSHQKQGPTHAEVKHNGRTLRSWPDDFRLAQSSGPYPGASATFLEGFFGRSVVAIGASKDDDVV